MGECSMNNLNSEKWIKTREAIRLTLLLNYQNLQRIAALSMM